MSVPTNGSSTALPLTIGVELEFILCARREEYTSPEFAWLQVHAPVESSEDEWSGKWSGTDRTFRLNPGLMWASRILQFRGLDHVVEADKHTEVQKWGLVPELTATIAGWDELPKHLPDRIHEDRVGEWDANGVELVSRILPAPDHTQSRVLDSDPTLDEIREYVEAFLGTPQTPWGAYANATCGLHVHVGLDPNLSQAGLLPLNVLQHLSYMLVQFETSISLLHPRGRRALADTMLTTGSMLGSNLMGLRQAEHVCKKVPLPPLESIQDRIFGADMTIAKLALLMSESARYLPDPEPIRYKFVNFFRLLSLENIARTIEFRQHDGSMDSEEISRWVLFVTRLVRAAERLARQPQIHMELPNPRVQGNKYKQLECKTQSDEYERLFNLMDMPQLERDYWMQKYMLYNPEEVRAKDELASISPTDCSVCAYEAKYLIPANKTDSSSEESPVSPQVPRLSSTPPPSIPLEEVEGVRTVWGNHRSVHTEGESGDEGDENEPSSSRSNGEHTAHEEFFW
jgi:hypothetical protein